MSGLSRSVEVMSAGRASGDAFFSAVALRWAMRLMSFGVFFSLALAGRTSVGRAYYRSKKCAKAKDQGQRDHDHNGFSSCYNARVDRGEVGDAQDDCDNDIHKPFYKGDCGSIAIRTPRGIKAAGRRASVMLKACRWHDSPHRGGALATSDFPRCRHSDLAPIKHSVRLIQRHPGETALARLRASTKGASYANPHLPILRGSS